MKNTLLILLCIISINITSTAQATRIWTGGSTGDWNDTSNWQFATLPADGDIAQFSDNVTVTATVAVTVTPAQINVVNGHTVTIDMDLTVGNGTYAYEALRATNGSNIILGTVGSNRIINANMPITQNGFQSSGTISTLTVASSTTLNIQQALNGLSGGIINNSGTINIESGVANRGIFQTGANQLISNSGTINIASPGNNGIELTNDVVFTNEVGGVVNLTEFNLFGIYVRTGASFTNLGTLNISGGIHNNSNGIDLNIGTLNNNGGTINIDDVKKVGIRNRASSNFVNDGTIIIVDTPDLMDNGIESLGIFTNGASGIIDISAMQNAGISVEGASTFTNHGSVDVVGSDAGGLFNAGLVVADGTFSNTSNNSLNASGGTNAVDGRAILIDNLGTLSNTGTITATDGKLLQLIANEGIFTNELGGTIDMVDGRISTYGGATFTNNGLLKTTNTTGGLQANGAATTAINNGFFDYGGGSWNQGNAPDVDNGIDLNGSPIDAMNMNTVDIAEQPYTWFDGATSLGSADATGSLTIADPSAVNITITTNLYDPGVVSIMIINLPATVPIELTYFRAKVHGKSVILNWQTSSEINNDYMAVERSRDGKEFIEIGKVVPKSPISYSTNDYTLEDNNPMQGMSYYRLRQVDLDGKTAFSDIEKVNFSERNKVTDISVFPTTTQNELTIRLNSEVPQPGSLQLFNINGQLMKQLSIENNSELKLSIIDFPSGQYFVRYINKDVIMTELIFKQ